MLPETFSDHKDYKDNVGSSGFIPCHDICGALKS